MEKPELIIITDMGPETGIGIYSYNLFKSLNSAGKRVAFLYTGYNHLMKEEGIIDYRRVESNGGYLNKGLAKLINQERSKRLNFIQETNVHLCGSSYSLSHFFNNPVATVHDLYFIKPFIKNSPGNHMTIPNLAYDYNILRNIINLKKITNIISISDVAREQVLLRTKRESTVIHHWIDKERFHARDKITSRKTLNLPLYKHILLNVSGGGPNKNLELLTSIASRLSEDWVLVKIGFPLYSKNVINIKRLDSELYPLLFNAADIYVHTSTFEGFGIPLIESLGSELPVIASNTPSSREILGVNATYFDLSESPKDIIIKIQEMFSKEKYNELISLSLDRAKLFSVEKIIPEYIDFYRKSFGIF
ncbi:MAG: glycosyltransferase, partial [Candidatus Thermoplasmatota archaeon]|nr:glycosyltransferase [Candidatus Thermoplasmatota archaeon]